MISTIETPWSWVELGIVDPEIDTEFDPDDGMGCLRGCVWAFAITAALWLFSWIVLEIYRHI